MEGERERYRLDSSFESKVRGEKQHVEKTGKQTYDKELVHQHRCKGCKKRYFCDDIECWEEDFESPCKYCGEFHIIDEAIDRKDTGLF